MSTVNTRGVFFFGIRQETPLLQKYFSSGFGKTTRRERGDTVSRVDRSLYDDRNTRSEDQSELLSLVSH